MIEPYSIRMPVQILTVFPVAVLVRKHVLVCAGSDFASNFCSVEVGGARMVLRMRV